ncbi:hypothetical protein SCH4B_4378 [Ruegeria sp. TrichCH4B]|nr:hypothetical protein SCH4B_4378 [Ruegeria sp. TrichCH4B]
MVQAQKLFVADPAHELDASAIVAVQHCGGDATDQNPRADTWTAL